jgi:hypothetical protein
MMGAETRHLEQAGTGSVPRFVPTHESVHPKPSLTYSNLRWRIPEGGHPTILFPVSGGHASSMNARYGLSATYPCG